MKKGERFDILITMSFTIKGKVEVNMYRLIHRDKNAKRGEFHTVHGVIQTPVFMNVGTAAAIKGAVSTMDLKEIYGMG